MVSASATGAGWSPTQRLNESATPDETLNEATPAALAAAWCQLIRASKEPGISDAESQALVERADAILDRLAETPTNAEAALAAGILFRNLRTQWRTDDHRHESVEVNPG
jgi:hypothetical protein